MNLELEILTPKEVLAKENKVDEIVIPAAWGQMGVLPMYTDFVTALTPGELTYRVGTNKKSHNITGGLFVVKNGVATILVDGLMATVTQIDDARKKKDAH